MHFDNLPTTTALIQRGIADSLHLGVQGFVSLGGDIILNDALGENAPAELLTPQHLMPWLSSGKPLTAAAVMLLVEWNLLKLDSPVASVIPEFAAAGKQEVTVRQLLTHTAGLKPILTGWPQKTGNEIVARICTTGLQRDWLPGQRAAYDPARSWFILGEIIRRVTGREVEEFVQRELCEPLGMHTSRMAMSPQQHREARLGILYTSKEGQLSLSGAHLAEACLNPSPGGSMRGPASELGTFYQMMLKEGSTAGGRQLLRPSTVHDMTRRVRQNMFDETFQHTLDFGLGLIVNSNRHGADTVPYGFGRHSSESAFGHGGAQSSIGFADPEKELAVVLIANGQPGDDEHNRRFRDLLTALYQDLGL